MREIEQALSSRINYSMVWEDDAVLIQGLGDRVEGRVLAIASGGDNVLALALAGAQVDAVDLSAPQLALTELKLQSWRLPYPQVLALFGLERADLAGAAYLQLRPHLSPPARSWWDANPSLFATGLLGIGRFERYLAAFRRRLLPLIHGAAAVDRWGALSDRAKRAQYYDEVWNNWRWRVLFQLFFSRPVMAALGRSPAQFAQVEGEVAAVLLRRVRRMFTAAPVAENRYAQWLLYEKWSDERSYPRWLTPEGQAALAEVAPRVTLHHGAIDAIAAARGPYDGYALSDIWEYLDSPAVDALWAALGRASTPGARALWWELLVPRPAGGEFVEMTELSSELSALDRVPFYGQVRVAVRA